MLTSVIIPYYKDLSGLKKCLAGLNNQSLPANEFEILIVNNEAKANTLHLELASNTFIYHEPNPGSYAARNTGIRLAKGEILAFTDSDCIPDKNWLQNGVQLFKNDADLERIGGEILLTYGASKKKPVELYEAVYAFDQIGNVRKGLSVTANLLVKKTAFLSYGHFNENLFSGGDFQWNREASAKGSKIVYGEKVMVSHPARHTFTQLRKKAKRVAGGQHGYVIQGANPIKSFFNLLWEFRPPIFEVKKIVPVNQLTRTDKIRVWLIRYWFRTLKAREQFKIEVLGQKAANL